MHGLKEKIRAWGKELGFDAVGIAAVGDLGSAEAGLQAWLAAGFHGDMDYMAAHGTKRTRPAELVPGTRSVICVRMNYRPPLPGETMPAADAPANTTATATAHVPAAAAATGNTGTGTGTGSIAHATNVVTTPGARDARAARHAPPERRAASADFPPPAPAPAATHATGLAAAPAAAPAQAIVARYAQGRDYHKLLRQRLQRLAERIRLAVGDDLVQRVFTDSAPVMEVELAQQAGLGWRGKHTLLLDREAGSYFFLGEIYTALDLPPDAPVTDHCGTCTACIDACPTQAIVAPGRLDARRCISYLTIEAKGAIPTALRTALGNRIYGCDDCQSACPWNRFSPPTREADFLPRQGLDRARLTELFAWDEAEFDTRLQGSPIRRIGHERWQRNIAVALGNALRVADPATAEALRGTLAAQTEAASPLLREHVAWALDQAAQATQATDTLTPEP